MRVAPAKTTDQLFHHFMRRLSARYGIIASKSQVEKLGKRCSAVIEASESSIGYHQDHRDLSVLDKQSGRVYVLKCFLKLRDDCSNISGNDICK